jgi:hypothetical protein
MDLLHTYSDGSKLYRMSAKALTRIPIWKGNRIIDVTHVNNIRDSIRDSIKNDVSILDSGYKIIQYDEIDETDKSVKKTYLIDGQHRMTIVTNYFETNIDANDFYLTVTEFRVESELEAIKYFNTINNVKPIQYQEDQNLIVNKYIQRLMIDYSGKSKLVRNGITKRPYLSVDKLRDALKKRIDNLKNISIDEFSRACKDINSKLLQELEIMSLNENNKEIKIINRTIELQFTLAWDDKFKWLDTILI